MFFPVLSSMAASQAQAAYQFVVKQSAALRRVPVSVCCCNPLEAFAATPLSLPQRPEHTVQTSEMHSQTPESYHDCFSSNNLHFLSSGLVRGDNRQSPLVLQGKNHCKVAPQVTVHHVWKQGSCFVCTDCTEVFVACEHSLDSHSQNIVQLLHRFEAPSIILVWAVCAARPDRTDNALHHRHSNTYIRYTPDQ